MELPKPFRLLDLPSLAHDVIFSPLKLEELYHLSKFSTRSRNVVRRFARRQKFSFEIYAKRGSFELRIQSHCGKEQFCHELRPSIRRYNDFPVQKVTSAIDYWGAAKEEIVFIMDVFSGRVKRLYMEVRNALEIAEFVKSISLFPVESVVYTNSLFIDDEIYKYVLKEFRDAKELVIGSSPSSVFRFDDMEPVNCEYLCIDAADWVTVDHLARCFSNVERVVLDFNQAKSQITPRLMHRFFKAWRNGSRIRELDLECDWTDIDLQAMLKNVPNTEVKRVEVRSRKKVFEDRECLLIRQEESGVEAVVYWGSPRKLLFPKATLSFTTNFRLLRDDEPVENRRRSLPIPFFF